MWEFSAPALNYLKQRLTPLNVVAQRRGRLVADIVLSKGDGRTDFPIPELGRILVNFQKLIDSLGSSSLTSTPTGRPSAATKRRTRLDAVGTFPSSFGIRIEANQGTLFDDGEADVAFSRFLSLLSGVGNEANLKLLLEQHSTETKLLFGQVVKDIAKADSSLRVSAGSARTELIETAVADAETLQAVADQIAEINKRNEREVHFEGKLRAISLKTKFFLLENEDESRSGRISDNLIESMSGKEINAPYRATLIERSELQELTGEITNRYILSNIEQLGPAE